MKFKVWCIIREKWLDESKYVIDSSGQLHSIAMTYIDFAEPGAIPIFSVEKLDENGIELFYGDICESRGSENTLKFVIIIHENNIKIKYLSGYINGMMDTLHDQISIVKIGSKYENPELLEK